MHNPAPVLENNTHKHLWHFDILTDHLISARRPDLIIINKKKSTCKIVGFAVPADHRIKLKECEKKDKYLDLARELKKKKTVKTVEHAGDFYTNCNWCVWNSNKSIIKGTAGIGSWLTSGDHTNNSIFEKARILRRVLETWGDLLSLRLQWKTIG